jgi:hypothetical protein
MGLASASAAAATLAIPGTAKSNQVETVATVPENPELLRLADAFQIALQKYKDAQTTIREIRGAWEHRWPLAPDTISTIVTDAKAHPRSREVDLMGSNLVRPGETYAREMADDWYVNYSLKQARRALNTKKMATAGKSAGRTKEQWEAILAEFAPCARDLDAYEAKCKRIHALSGINEAKAAREVAGDQLVAIAQAVMLEPDRTMAGVLIKADVVMMVQIDNALLYKSMFPKEGVQLWGFSLAASIIRLAETGGAA